jgi:hypothetical protein
VIPVKVVRNAFWSWVPIAVAVCCLGLLGYAAVQQVYRNGANDPQLQLAQDAAQALAGGATAASVVGTRTVQLHSGTTPGSLAPFLIVFDRKGAVIASSARLEGSSPVPPRGVLDSAVSKGRNMVTWQPDRDVRVAAVAVPDRQGPQARYVVLAGRSLREVENRIAALGEMALVGWVSTLVMTFIAALVGERFSEGS